MKKLALGPLGMGLAANMKRLREAQRLTYVEISAQLDTLGRPIPVIGLRRIEMDERRVDVDEAAALARVLGVPFLQLLLPVGDEATIELFADEERPTWALAKWLTGEAAYPEPGTPSGSTPLVGGSEANQAWAAGSTALTFHREHDRLIVNWHWAAGQAELRDTAKEREGVREAEQAVREFRQNMARRGMTLPVLPEELRHLDGDKPRATRRKPTKS